MGNLTEAFMVPAGAVLWEDGSKELEEIDRALKQLPTEDERAKLLERKKYLVQVLGSGRD